MNYNSFLDAWFGNGWFCWGIPFFLYFLFIVFSVFSGSKRNKGDKEKNEENKYEAKTKSKKRFRPVTILYYVVPLFIIFLNGDINPLWLGYGKPKEITSIQYREGKLFIMDYIRTSGGKTSSGMKCYRIHVLDPATGQKQRRFSVGTGAKIFGLHADLVGIYHYSDKVVYYSVSTGKKTKVYNKKNLATMYPEFASGVNDFIPDPDNETIDVKTLDGNRWYLYPYQNKLVKKLPEVKDTITNKLYIDGGDIRIDDVDYGGTMFINMRNVQDGPDKFQLFDKNDLPMYKEDVFLHGAVMIVSNADSLFIVRHYETVKDEKFIFSAYRTNGSKKLWEIRQSQLNPTFKLTSYKKLTTSWDYKDHLLIFNVSKEIVAVDVRDGKIKWRIDL